MAKPDSTGISSSRSSVSSTKSNSENEIENDSSSPIRVSSDSALRSITQSPNTDEEMIAYPDTNAVVDAVECLQQRKLKPDVERIAIYIEKKFPKVYQREPEIVEKLVKQCLAQGLIVYVNNLDVLSFRTPSKIGRMHRISKTKILPYEGDIPIEAVHEVLRTIGLLEVAAPDSTAENPRGLGASLERIVNYLHESLRLLNYNETLLRIKVLPIAINKGFATRITDHRFTLTDFYRQNFCVDLKPNDGTTEADYQSDDSEKIVVVAQRSRSKSSKKIAKRNITSTSNSSNNNNNNNKNDSSNNSVVESPNSDSDTFTSIRANRRKLNDAEIEPDEDDEDESKPDIKDIENDASNDDSKNFNLPQRVSTRKKFKKSLGPDFVDTSEQLMYYLKESTTYIPRCFICTGGFPKYKPQIFPASRKGKSADNEPADPNMVSCCRCELKAHVLCLTLSENVGLKGQWQCGTCGSCVICKQTRRKDFCISCKSCKRSHHTFCVSIRRNDAASSDSAWECGRCYARTREQATLGSSNSSNNNNNNNNSLLKNNKSGDCSGNNHSSSSSSSSSTRILNPICTTSASKSPLLCANKPSPACSSGQLLLAVSGPPPTTGTKSSVSLLSKSNDSITINNNNKNNNNNNNSIKICSSSSSSSSNNNNNSILLPSDASAAHVTLTAKPKSVPVLDKQTREILQNPAIRDLILRGNTATTDINTTTTTNNDNDNNNGGDGANRNNNSHDITEKVESVNNSNANSDEETNDNKIEANIPVVNRAATKSCSEYHFFAGNKKVFALKDMLDRNAPMDIKRNFIAWLNCELKDFIKCNPMMLYSLPNQVSRWKPLDVYNFMVSIGLDRSAEVLLKNNVDGIAFLLLRREDILERLNLKMGPALKLYAFLTRLREEMNDNKEQQ